MFPETHNKVIPSYTTKTIKQGNGGKRCQEIGMTCALLKHDNCLMLRLTFVMWPKESNSDIRELANGEDIHTAMLRCVQEFAQQNKFPWLGEFSSIQGNQSTHIWHELTTAVLAKSAEACLSSEPHDLWPFLCTKFNAVWQYVENRREAGCPVQSARWYSVILGQQFLCGSWQKVERLWCETAPENKVWHSTSVSAIVNKLAFA